MTFDHEINQKRIYDIDREEFNFIRYLTLYNQSEYHVKTYNSLLLLIAIMFLIMVAAESFSDVAKLFFVISLLFFAGLAIKIERWFIFCIIDKGNSTISKKMIIFGRSFILFEEDTKEISGFYKLEYEMVYYLAFKNSNKKISFQYSRNNPRQDIVKYFSKELNLELQEVTKKGTN